VIAAACSAGSSTGAPEAHLRWPVAPLVIGFGLVVAIRTVHGGASGRLFQPAAAAPPK
jgi:glycerol uptake facilitator-like aquaporin